MLDLILYSPTQLIQEVTRAGLVMVGREERDRRCLNIWRFKNNTAVLPTRSRSENDLSPTVKE